MNVNDEWAEAVPLLCEPRFSQSLERGIAILGCFSPETPLRGIAEMADELGMHRSTTHRYVTTLVALGHLKQAPDRRYRLALGVTRLGISVMNAVELREHAHWPLVDLRIQTGFTVSLAVLDGTVIEYVDRLQMRRREDASLALEVGARLPAHNTALGKLLLAHLPSDERRHRTGEIGFSRTGPKSITSRKRLERELGEIREEGIALADEELAPRVVAVAVPVRDYSGEVVAAASLSSDTRVIDVDTLADRLAPHLVVTADRISARLGFRRADEPRSGRSDLHRFRPEGRD